MWQFRGAFISSIRSIDLRLIEGLVDSVEKLHHACALG